MVSALPPSLLHARANSEYRFAASPVAGNVWRVIVPAACLTGAGGTLKQPLFVRVRRFPVWRDVCDILRNARNSAALRQYFYDSAA